jgi:hypothetical protein
MPTSGPLLETLAGAAGGLGAGLGLGWWYFRRGAAEGATADDDAEAPPPLAADAEGVRRQLADLRRSHDSCIAALAERDRLVSVLREQAAGMAARLSDIGAPGPTEG